MDNDQLRRALTAEESRLAALRDDIRTADELDLDQQSESGGELSNVDQHPADIATEQQYREQDLSLLEQIEAELTDVERALAKLNDGTYGKCEACGNDIEPERLRELPATRFCKNDAQAEQSQRITPAQQTIDVSSNTQAPI